MNAFIIAITLICQNQKHPPTTGAETIEQLEARASLQKQEEIACLKRLHRHCSQFVEDTKDKLTTCMAKNM